MVIVKEFAAKFQIQLAAELFNTLLDLFRLIGKVFLIVESDLFHKYVPLIYKSTCLVYHNIPELERVKEKILEKNL